MTFNSGFNARVRLLGRSARLAASMLGAVTVALTSAAATGNERHFAYTYESAVMPKGGREVELWVTDRVGRPTLFNRFETRMAFEYGVTDHLTAELYLNS